MKRRQSRWSKKKRIGGRQKGKTAVTRMKRGREADKVGKRKENGKNY